MGQFVLYFEWDDWPNLQGSYEGQLGLFHPFNIGPIEGIKLRP